MGLGLAGEIIFGSVVIVLYFIVFCIWVVSFDVNCTFFWIGLVVVFEKEVFLFFIFLVLVMFEFCIVCKLVFGIIFVVG